MILGKNGVAKFTFSIYASNASVKKQLATEFEGSILAITNFTSTNFVLWPVISATSISDLKMTVNNCGMETRDYTKLFGDVLDMGRNIFNTKYVDGFDIRTLNSNLPFIAGMFKNLTITPYQEDGFYYMGFSFFID